MVGKVSEIFRGTSKDDTPHVFLNIGSWRWKCFTIVLWNEALQLFEASGKNPDEYQDQWLSVTGMLTAYERRPQILINSPTDIQLLAGEEEAKKLLGPLVNPPDRPVVARPAVWPTSQKDIKPIQAVPDSETANQSSAQRIQGSLDQTHEVLAQIEKLFSNPKDLEQ